MKKVMTLLIVFIPLFIYSQNNPAKFYDKNKTSYPIDGEILNLCSNFAKSEINKDSLINEIYVLFNEYRKYVGLDTLILDTNLSKAAEIQSKYCLLIDEVTHENSNFLTSKDRLNKTVTGNIKWIGEIITISDFLIGLCRNRSLSESVLDSFFNSSAHKNIIEQSDSTKIGISVQKFKDIVYTVIIFGKNK